MKAIADIGSKAGLFAAATLILAACAPEAVSTEADEMNAMAAQALADEPGDPLAATVQPGETFGGMVLSTRAADTTTGERPELAVSCSELGTNVHFGIKDWPGGPAPLRGVFGMLTIDGTATRMEMGGFPGMFWTPRELPAAQELRLVRTIADAKTVTLDGMKPYAPTPVTWTIKLAASERQRFKRACV